MGLSKGLQRGTLFLIALAVTLGLLAVHPMLIESSQATIHDATVREDRVVIWSHPGASPGDRVAYHYSGLDGHQLFRGMEVYVVPIGGHAGLANGSEPPVVYLHREHPDAGAPDASGGLPAEDAAPDGAWASAGVDPWISFLAPGPATDRGASPIEVVWVLHAKPGEPLFTAQREQDLIEGWMEERASHTVDGTVTFESAVKLEPWIVGLEGIAVLATVGLGTWWTIGLFRRVAGEAPARELEALARLAEQGPTFLSALRNALAACLVVVLAAGIFATAWWTAVVDQLFLAPQATLGDEVLMWILLVTGALIVAVIVGLIVWIQRELSGWEGARQQGRLEV